MTENSKMTPEEARKIINNLRPGQEFLYFSGPCLPGRFPSSTAEVFYQAAWPKGVIDAAEKIIGTGEGFVYQRRRDRDNFLYFFKKAHRRF